MKPTRKLTHWDKTAIGAAYCRTEKPLNLLSCLLKLLHRLANTHARSDVQLKLLTLERLEEWEHEMFEMAQCSRHCYGFARSCCQVARFTVTAFRPTSDGEVVAALGSCFRKIPQLCALPCCAIPLSRLPLSVCALFCDLQQLHSKISKYLRSEAFKFPTCCFFCRRPAALASRSILPRTPWCHRKLRSSCSPILSRSARRPSTYSTVAATCAVAPLGAHVKQNQTQGVAPTGHTGHTAQLDSSIQFPTVGQWTAAKRPLFTKRRTAAQPSTPSARKSASRWSRSELLWSAKTLLKGGKHDGIWWGSTGLWKPHWLVTVTSRHRKTHKPSQIRQEQGKHHSQHLAAVSGVQTNWNISIQINIHSLELERFATNIQKHLETFVCAKCQVTVRPVGRRRRPAQMSSASHGHLISSSQSSLSYILNLKLYLSPLQCQGPPPAAAPPWQVARNLSRLDVSQVSLNWAASSCYLVQKSKQTTWPWFGMGQNCWTSLPVWKLDKTW